MPERGPTSNQSGIFYQNSVAALFLGRLCDPTERLASEAVVHIRVEAPQHVDDIVITFADSHKTYIQAKENIRVTDEAWGSSGPTLKTSFGVLILCVGVTACCFLG